MADLGRRGFFSRFGLLAGAAALPSPPAETRPDVSELGGRAVWWSGWRTSSHQDAQIGWWTASVPPDEHGHDLVFSTVGGVIHRGAPLHVVDGSYRKEWPPLTMRSSPVECEAVKRRALQHLVDHLNG